MAPDEVESVKVYTVNGAASGSSSSLPDWLTRKRAIKGKGKRAIREQVQGTIDLIQHFEFPEASNRIKTTRDGHHAVATGTYKPQMRVYDLDQLTLKFERHSDAENVDFVILSDDWTKTLHLQNDRTIELHNQGGLYYKTRLPRFGRSLAYHYPSCDAIFGASGPEVYRLNLAQGRFLSPLNLGEDDEGEVEGVNCIDINPAHQLLAFGTEGSRGTVEFWDPRSRSRVGVLALPKALLGPSRTFSSAVLPGGTDLVSSSSSSLSVTALSSRSDGLSLAVGTSTGHTLLYDLRSARHFALKDQGYGLPVKSLSWIEGGSKMAGDGMVLSADKKVIKIWDRNSPSVNFASVTPAADINHVHHIPASGLLMLANEGIQMTSYYIPQLGPAPKWCSFLDNITEEMEEQTTRSVYEDFKFVERSELSRLGLDHLIGTPTLKPYMHGYFLSLGLYDAARLIANPFAYAEHREKIVRQKMDKLAESRIRTRKDDLPKINRALAEKIRKTAEREERRLARKHGDAAEEGDERGIEVENGEKKGKGESKERTNLLNDPRFAELFENPEFEVDEDTREFAMLNPTGAAAMAKKRKTAVEEEEDESDKPSSDGLSHTDDNSEDEKDNESDQSDGGAPLVDFKRYNELVKSSKESRMTTGPASKQPQSISAKPQAPLRPTSDPQVKKLQRLNQHGPRMVPVQLSRTQQGTHDRSAPFGQRRQPNTSSKARDSTRAQHNGPDSGARTLPDGGMEFSYVPAASSKPRGKGGVDEPLDPADMLVPGGRGIKAGKKKRLGVEEFGHGMEKGLTGPVRRGPGDADQESAENERSGRTKRRTGVRSGSKNVFRRI